MLPDTRPYAEGTAPTVLTMIMTSVITGQLPPYERSRRTAHSTTEPQTSRLRGGRDPTTLISPRDTFMNWGDSSMPIAAASSRGRNTRIVSDVEEDTVTIGGTQEVL